jgi:hypothetical protein
MGSPGRILTLVIAGIALEIAFTKLMRGGDKCCFAAVVYPHPPHVMDYGERAGG